ncbi:MAG TPA: hypothetical protein VGQ71_03965 [Terriglobales bacterium]|jgi:hypothetical protein|nr:hypothetical protein [Terriglobales bacterium]
MKRGLALSVTLLVALAGWAQTGKKTYTSPDGVFSFSYPSSFNLHTDPEHHHARLCSDYIVCLTYDPSQYAGSDFAGATFWVENPVQLLDNGSTAQAVITEADCLAFRTYEQEPVSAVRINGVKFATVSFWGAAGGTSDQVQLFRTFHHGKCYELGAAWSIASSGYEKEDYESGRVKHFTKASQKKIRAALNAIVKGFHFLK